MKGETVTVRYGSPGGGADPFNAEAAVEVSQDVENVLVQPGGGKDDFESVRPDGVQVDYTLLFPKLFVYGVDPQILRGATVVVRGKECRVVGSPDVYGAEGCPTEWALSADVRRVDG
ncbi:MAG: hypothetical protein LBR00_03060 [Clostridiales Family XIII bacterium]|nr:hypothetical protein [Clostridiales Family XIII bacterium]